MAMNNTAEVRRFLMEQMAQAAEGKQTLPTSKAICNYAQQIYNTINLEVKHAQIKAKLGDGPLAPVEFNDGQSPDETSAS